MFEIQTELARYGLKLADRPITELSIDDPRFKWSIRAYNAVQNLGIDTVGDLTLRTPEELLKLKNVGRKTVFEIQTELTRHGLKLAEGPLPGAPGQKLASNSGMGALFEEMLDDEKEGWGPEDTLATFGAGVNRPTQIATGL